MVKYLSFLSRPQRSFGEQRYFDSSLNFVLISRTLLPRDVSYFYSLQAFSSLGLKEIHKNFVGCIPRQLW